MWKEYRVSAFARLILENLPNSEDVYVTLELKLKLCFQLRFWLYYLALFLLSKQLTQKAFLFFLNQKIQWIDILSFL